MSGEPRHAKGLFVYYGPQHLIEANAAWHHYDLSPFHNRCGVSALSPADLGKVVWLRSTEVDTGWYGPCLTIDVGAQHDFFRQVFQTQEIAEVPESLRDLFQFRHGSSGWGEIYFGQCPPPADSVPQYYRPPLTKVLWTGRDPRVEQPAQEWPGGC